MLSLKAGGTGLNLTAANHVVLYDRWWNPAVEDQARDRAWRIGQQRTVISHRLVCPGTIDERVEEVVAGKRHIAQLVLPRSSSIADLDVDQLRHALGLQPDELLTDDSVMNQPAKKRRPTRRTTARRPTRPFDPWRGPGAAARRRADAAARRRGGPAALARRPPARRRRRSLASYFSAVVERAASVATALALSTELPAAPPDSAAEPPD